DSPTNLILERVICAPSSTVYVCGQNGVVLRGRGMQFETIKQTTVEDDFWGMEWFEGKLWLATHESLFTLNEDELIPVDMGVGEPLTCGWLHANDGVIWSVGPEDLAFYDGKTWSEVILT
ncbi:MAG TPA: hypothetical protein PK614_07540, partial [Nitrospira sp.]|nr:hypothetical protein [Nitrospira sp.]